MLELPNNLKFYLRLLAVTMVILGARLWLIDTQSVLLPYYDEWEVGFYTLLPWLGDHLTWLNIIIPYGEHPIALTRLLTLGLTILNDNQWDSVVSMVANAFIYATTIFIFALILRDSQGKHLENWILLTMLIIGAIPFGWINILWGFQSSWYLMLLLTLLTFWGLLLYEMFTWQWWLGITSGVLVSFNLASGFFALIVVIAIKLYEVIVAKEQAPRHYPTLLLGIIFTTLGLIQFICAPKHGELYSKDFHTFFWSLLKFLAWPWIDYPLLSLFMYLPFVALVGKLLWLRRDPSRAELFLLALGGWIILQTIAMAFARGAGEGVHPIARYWEIMSFGIVANLFSFHLLTQPWYNLPQLIQRPLNVVVKVWGGLVLVGIYVLTIQALPDIKATKMMYRNYLTTVRTFISTDNFNILRQQGTPYPFPEVLAHFLKLPRFRSLLPSSLAITPLIPASESSSSDNPFVPNGFYPTTKQRGEEVWGSYNGLANLAVGRFNSVTIKPTSHRFLEIPVSGYLSQTDLTLSLEIQGEKQTIKLTPHRLAREGWVSIFVRNPKQPFKIVAEDQRQDLWFAFAMPRGVGRLSMYSQYLLESAQVILVIGFVLIILLLKATVFEPLTRFESSP